MEQVKFPKIRWAITGRDHLKFHPAVIVLIGLMFIAGFLLVNTPFNRPITIVFAAVWYLLAIYMALWFSWIADAAERVDHPSPEEGSVKSYIRIFNTDTSLPTAKSRQLLVLLVIGITCFTVEVFYGADGVKTSALLELISTKAALVLLLLWPIMRILQYFIEDYFRITTYYLSYFYSSILSIVILTFLIAQQEQFGSFFIELMDSPGNLIAFSVLFLISIVIVWFAPYYLLFTDTIHLGEPQFDGPEPGILEPLVKGVKNMLPGRKQTSSPPDKENRRRNYRQLYKLTWLHKGRVDYYRKIKAHKEPAGFTLLRTIMGIVYIAILAALSGAVVLKSLGPEREKLSIFIFLGTVGLCLLWIFIYFLRIRDIKKEEKNQRIVGQNLPKYWFWNLIAYFILVAILISSSFLIREDSNSIDLFRLLIYFVVTTVLSAVIFTNVGYLYYATSLDALDRKTQLKTYRFSKPFISVILWLNLAIALLAVIAFLGSLILGFDFTYAIFQNCNGINIYLLLVNGLIAALTIIDRLLRIRAKIEDLREREGHESTVTGEQETIGPKRFSPFVLRAAALTWAVLLLLGGMMYYFAKAGNDYHQVNYLSADQAGRDESWDLKMYFTEFLNRLDRIAPPMDSSPDTTALNPAIPKPLQPLIMVAADGGGLKAAYWTMLVLAKMEELGLKENICLMSGASGGAIGEGIYAYYRARMIQTNQAGRSNENELEVLRKLISSIGNTNFISSDFAGLLTRWPMRYLPNFDGIMKRQDRMEAMAEHYFKIMSQADNSVVPSNAYDNLRHQPYHYLWSSTNYRTPLLITNTARAEDGIKGWSHPLAYDEFFQAGVIDLTRKKTIISENGNDRKEETKYISFPDALFLANRFPIMSPAARIKGKGHFIDAGALDNSGVGTILQVLFKLKAQYPDLFQRVRKRGIYIVSIRHDRGRWIAHNFPELRNGHLGETRPRSEVSAFLSGVVQAGMSGDPKIFDEIIDKGEAKEMLAIKDLLRINLPFRLTYEDVESYYHREIIPSAKADSVKQKIELLNQNIIETLDPAQRHYIVEPPLGRLISRPAREYGEAMLKHPQNEAVFGVLGL